MIAPPGIYDSRLYTYDANSRLSSANYSGKGLTSHAYDWVGNQTSPGNMDYNDADELTVYDTIAVIPCPKLCGAPAERYEEMSRRL